MPDSTLDQLASRQEAALAVNTERKRLVVELKASNAALSDKVTQLEQAGVDVTGLAAELARATDLLEELQDAVLSDDEAPADPPSETPVPVDPTPADEATEAPAEDTAIDGDDTVTLDGDGESK